MVSKGFLWLSSVVRRSLFWFIPLVEKSATGQSTVLTSDLQENVFDTVVTRLLQWPGGVLEAEDVHRFACIEEQSELNPNEQIFTRVFPKLSRWKSY